jgi:sulfur-oxidizing protein SoxZ
MAAKPKARVHLPTGVKTGEIIEIKTLISHVMESGQRKDDSGNAIPRHIINKFTASFNGKEFMSADWHPAVSANPYQSLFFKATESGKLEFVWYDDDGSTYTATADLQVS